MKTIGLLGGTSWPSTISYYEKLNQLAQEQLGGNHSAEILLYSIDYESIKSRYHHGWNEIPGLLAQKIEHFLQKEPDCLILCNNTLHRALDRIESKLKIKVPVFHAGHLAAEDAVQQNMKTVLLLGTAFTMEDGFYAKYFEARGVRVIIPAPEDRKEIQRIQSNVARGDIDPAYSDVCADILRRYRSIDAVVLACTELPLVIDQRISPKPLINPVDCQCYAATQFAFGPALPLNRSLERTPSVQAPKLQ